MKQPLFGKTYGNIGSAPLYTILHGHQWAQNDIDANSTFKHTQPWSVAGSFKNLYYEILAPVENKDSLYWEATTFTLYINEVATALTVTVPAMGPIAQNGFQASAQDITHSVSISPGDSVSLRRTPPGTIHGNTNAAYANIDWSLTFESTNPKESSYGSGSVGGKINTLSSVYWLPILTPTLNGFVGIAAPDTVDQYNGHSIVPLAGSLTRVDFHLNSAPGANEFTFYAYKNGIKQDGSGGTVNTAMHITGSATRYAFTFDLPYAVLNWGSIHLDQTLTVGTYNDYINVSTGFTATTDGQSALCFNSGGGTPTNDGTTDYVGSDGSGWAWTTANSPTPTPSWRPSRWPCTELLISYPGPIDTFQLSGLCVNLSARPGVGKSRLFTTRQNFIDTVSNVTLSENNNPGSYLKQDPLNGSVTFTSVSDRLDLSAVGTGSPATTKVGWTWLVTSVAVPFNGGIYKIVPDKRNDTLFNTGVVKIPNPFFKTGLIGG